MLCPAVLMILRFDTLLLSYLLCSSLTNRTRQKESLQIPSHTLLFAPALHANMQIIRPPAPSPCSESLIEIADMGSKR